MIMKLKTHTLFNPLFSFVIDNKLRGMIENIDKEMEFMGVKPGMRVLEAGCGSGFISPVLSKAVGENGFVVSVDIQEEMIKKARRKRGCLRNVDFRTESVSDLSSVKDEEIDLAFLYYSFHEADKKDKVAGELYRVLKQNGVLSIKEPRFEVSKKDMQSYKKLITNHGFTITESLRDCDFLGCYLKFVKNQ